MSGSVEEIDLENVEVLHRGEGAPSATSSFLDDAAEGLEDELLVLDDEDDDEPSAPESVAAKSQKDVSGQNAMLSAMIAAKNEAVEALAQTQQEAQSLRERLMRVSAEIENSEKRQGREKQDLVRFANENLLKKGIFHPSAVMCG